MIRDRLVNRLRTALSGVLSATGLLWAFRRARLQFVLATSPDIRRREREERGRFAAFSRDHGAALGHGSGTVAGTRTALIVSGRCPTLETELCLVKTLQLAGYRPVVLLEDEQRALRPYYELAGVAEIHYWSGFLTSSRHGPEAAVVLRSCKTLDDLLGFAMDGVRIGRIAACTALRERRGSTLDLGSPDVRQHLTKRVALSLSAAEEARRILARVRPALVVFVSTAYSPKGELFDTSLEEGLDVVAYDAAHRRNSLIFKRYCRNRRDRHLATLSPESWRHVQRMAWTPDRRDRVQREVAMGYAAGSWCGGSGAHGRARLVAPQDLQARLGLDPRRATACLFPHILWDAPWMWATMLFPSYEEWFLETVRAACADAHINWIIKLHPANVRKQLKEGYAHEPAELRSLRDHVGALPAHVHVLPPDTDISTFSLFAIMDYCLTVRGTVGIEAARLGIPVLTAGASRFSHLGFTVDSETGGQYLHRLARIDETPALTPEQTELAGRYAYGLFVLRPSDGQSWDADDASGWVAAAAGRPRARITIRTDDEWRRSADVTALAQWFASNDEDFLNSRE